MLDADVVTRQVASLWAAHGGPRGPIILTPCAVSGNNRVYRVDGNGHAPVIAKFYFRSNPGDRDRLDAEWQFLSHAQRVGIKCAPRQDNLALYSFVAGSKLDSPRLGQSHVLAAADFIRVLNAPASLAKTTQMPNAAEACFTLGEHLTVVERRLSGLDAIQAHLSVDRQAVALVAEMRDYWQRLRPDLLAGLTKLGLAPDHLIPPHERVLSPSDFGFHNALVGEGGDLSFIDFEYAGWDDVAKLAADFFFQPAIPVPPDLFPLFLDRLLQDRPQAAETARRIRLLRPLFGVKWVCILLNLFLPDMAQRRRFADPDHDEVSSKTAQLEKARRAFQTLIGTPWHT